MCSINNSCLRAISLDKTFVTLRLRKVSKSCILTYEIIFRREDTTKDKYHYSLTWTCEFPNMDDKYYFAHCYPYTYSDLQVSH